MTTYKEKVMQIDVRNKESVHVGRRGMEMILGRYIIPKVILDRAFGDPKEVDKYLELREKMMEYGCHAIINLKYIAEDPEIEGHDLEVIAFRENQKKFEAVRQQMKPLYDKVWDYYKHLIEIIPDSIAGKS